MHLCNILLISQYIMQQLLICISLQQGALVSDTARKLTVHKEANETSKCNKVHFVVIM
jgi:hypothetical protein